MELRDTGPSLAAQTVRACGRSGKRLRGRR
jgi:hypothetical protein